MSSANPTPGDSYPEESASAESGQLRLYIDQAAPTRPPVDGSNPAEGHDEPDELLESGSDETAAAEDLPEAMATVAVKVRPVCRRARLVVAYDGGSFHGFAVNAGVETVAGRLTEAISKITRMDVELVGAGRTDAGVHGWGQVISTDLPEKTALDDLARRVNSMLGPVIVVRSADWAPEQFNARFSALWRHYRYTVLNSPQASPFLTATAWHVARPLDVKAMQLGCDAFIGEHDFSAFCRKPKGQSDPVMVRRVLLAKWSQPEPQILRFEIRANAFCHQMVRSIVGTLVEVGLGKRRPGDLRSVLVAHNRAGAGSIAPPQGLCLWEVGYPSDEQLADGLVPDRRGNPV